MKRAPEYATILQSICEDPALRRQFLWLRAQEKGDLETARDLEAVDHTLSACVAALQAEFIARGGRMETPAQRREAFAQMQDQLFVRCTEALGKH